jgi:hypothetical protein
MYGTPSTRSTLTICACEPTITAGLREAESSRSTSATSLRSPSWLASPGSGSSVGWWAKTITCLTLGSPAASSSASCSIGSCAQSEPRNVPRVLLSSTKRTPLWSNVRYGEPKTAL